MESSNTLKNSNSNTNNNKKNKRKKENKTTSFEKSNINSSSTVVAGSGGVNGNHMISSPPQSPKYNSMSRYSVLSTSSDDEISLNDKLKKRKGNTSNGNVKGIVKEQQQVKSVSISTSVATSTTTTSTTTIVNFEKKEDEFDIYQNVKFEVELIKAKRSTIHVRDIQNYILWLLSDFQVSLPTWIFTKNKPLLKKLVVVCVPGISQLLFEKITLLSGKSWFDKILPHRIPLNIQSTSISLPPNPSPYFHLLNIKSKSNHNTKVKEKIVPIHHYILDYEQLIENNYPLPHIDLLNEGWVQTVKDEQLQTQQQQGKIIYKLIAIDCEMCRTNLGLEVTRISVVNEKKEVLMDEYVKPENEIIDYLTIYSGITVETLENVTTKLSDIQEKLLKLIDHSTILLGHSLENDLKSLKMVHMKIIDTSVIYPTGGTNKFPLRYLTQKYLKRTIQGGKEGHSSVEDAVAVLDLVKLKHSRGKQFGIKDTFESIFNRIQAYKRKSTMVDTYENINHYATSVVSSIKCQNGNEVVEKMTKQVGKNGPSDLIVCQFTELANYFSSIDNNKFIKKSNNHQNNNYNSNNNQNTNNNSNQLNSSINTENNNNSQQNTESNNSPTLSNDKDVEENVQQPEEQNESLDETPKNNNDLDPKVTNESNNNNNNNNSDKLEEVNNPDLDQSTLQEIKSWDGFKVTGELLEHMNSVYSKISSIWDSMTPNSMMILLGGPGPMNDVNLYRGQPGKEKEFIMSLETSKEGFASIGIK